MISFAYSRRTSRAGAGAVPAGIVAAALLVSTQLGCTAGVKATQTGGPGAGGGTSLGSAGTTGAAGTSFSGAGGTFGTTGQAGTTVVSNPDGGCKQDYQVMFVPKIPTVYLLVDRSGSMFHCLMGGDMTVCNDPTNTSWAKLKDAIEAAIVPLDAQVRFGFATIYGTGNSCPVRDGTITDNLAPAVNNAAAIRTLYDGIKFPDPSTASSAGLKLESPASYALAAVSGALQKISDPGPKYILFITDGQEDYCDDALAICASDSVVGQLQTASTLGIRTIVFGIQSSRFDLPPGTLQSFANAGAGEATLVPLTTGLDVNAFYDQCYNSNVAGWKADLAASGKTAARGVSVGTYSSTMGPTTPFTPNATDSAALVAQLSMALSGVKGCSFDLDGHIKVNTKMLDRASVLIEGKPVPLDPDNGWTMTSDTVLELKGSACQMWRAPNVNDIKFNFPCEIIIN